MLSALEAKRIGLRACIQKIGPEFVKKYADNAVSSWGESDGIMNYFVGVNDIVRPVPDLETVESLFISSGNNWPYFAFCDVDMRSGVSTITECRIPA